MTTPTPDEPLELGEPDSLAGTFIDQINTLKRDLAAAQERAEKAEAERDAAVKDAERHRAMRAQFANGANISIYLPTAQPRFVDESSYSTPESYEYDIDRAIAVNMHDAAIDAAREGR